MTAELAWGVAGASLLGSWHCALMCGPFAAASVFAASPEGVAVSWPQRLGRVAAYHLGRLATYLLLTALVNALGISARGWAEKWGLEVNATAATLVFIGVWGIWQLRGAPVPFASRIGAGLAAPLAFFRRLPSRFLGPLGTGFVTTWIPCGWLYGFVALAGGGQATIGAAFGLILAFWAGGIPALVLSAVLPSAAYSAVARYVPLSTRSKRAVAALLLISVFAFTGWRAGRLPPARQGATAPNVTCH